ncbi:acyltransferase family protein [Novipirellula artificiosorum]|uniref:Acyltransferase family protein n=1 Tax=Novipirellula artificiosorum TaxID=2528016 RepID=A0A5C6DSQ7_9BACT|nr:acyltransferase [Novipirellula artificiosorum]TWU39760.1 Acyltransferase family protein [Novipirellula artificiosorum]
MQKQEQPSSGPPSSSAPLATRHSPLATSQPLATSSRQLPAGSLQATRDSLLPRPREAWIDWMKVIGMALIILGHTGAHMVIPLTTNPFNFKQLGVAFFVFITGYTLTIETRRPSHVVFNRYFEVALFGLLIAGVLSVIQCARIGDLNESNYLPFALGLNVFWENAFPANPTTWYVGTYFHILIAWAMFFRHIRVTVTLLMVTAVIEIVIRSLVMAAGRDYTAYMLMTNWIVVFLFGRYFGQLVTIESTKDLIFRAELIATDSIHTKQVAMVSLLLLTGFAVFWTWIAKQFHFTAMNPFGRIPAASQAVSLLLTSASVTLQYTIYTLLAFLVFRSSQTVAIVRFLAANTLLVFLTHMPLIYAVSPLWTAYVPQGFIRLLCNLVVYFVLLALLCSLVKRLIQPQKLRSILGRRLFGASYQKQRLKVGARHFAQ